MEQLALFSNQYIHTHSNRNSSPTNIFTHTLIETPKHIAIRKSKRGNKGTPFQNSLIVCLEYPNHYVKKMETNFVASDYFSAFSLAQPIEVDDEYSHRALQKQLVLSK